MRYHPGGEGGPPEYDHQFSRARSLSEQQARRMCALAPIAAPGLCPALCVQLTVHLMVDLGARITRYQVDYLVVTLAGAVGVPDAHQVFPHSTRHAFNTIAKACGATLEQRQRALAHVSADTTALYDHTDESLSSDPQAQGERKYDGPQRST